jgi:hypothetical protein
MTSTASTAFFSVLIIASIIGAAIAACVLIAMVIRDWRGKRLW